MLDSLRLDCTRETDRIVDFIQRHLHGAGFQRALLGLSGGIDSALVAALCVRALGGENVLGLILPCESSSPQSEAHARLLIAQLGMAHKIVDITPMVAPFVARYPDMSGRRRGNVMARCRMICLYDESEAYGGLVMGTSNRTETLLGYFTLYGDGAAAIEPIGHLYKYQVRQLARYLDVPEPIITKPPSADLWAGQTDEGELGFSYDAADQVLYLATEEGLDSAEIAAQGFDERVVQAVLDRMASSAFKRRLPPVPSLQRGAK